MRVLEHWNTYRTAEVQCSRLALPSENSGKESGHEPPNVDSTAGRRGGRIGIVDVTAFSEGVCAAQSTRSIRAGLQPVPGWHPPFQLEFRDISGDTRDGCRRKSRACAVARLTAPDS